MGSKVGKYVQTTVFMAVCVCMCERAEFINRVTMQTAIPWLVAVS